MAYVIDCVRHRSIAREIALASPHPEARYESLLLGVDGNVPEDATPGIADVGLDTSREVPGRDPGFSRKPREVDDARGALFARDDLCQDLVQPARLYGHRLHRAVDQSNRFTIIYSDVSVTCLRSQSLFLFFISIL